MQFAMIDNLCKQYSIQFEWDDDNKEKILYEICSNLINKTKVVQIMPESISFSKNDMSNIRSKIHS
jgi:hypothetical protein